jgi:recombinational DNA repair ATPase RecF
MRLKSFYIGQYKNLKDFTLNFAGNSFIDVFVGKNATGKSNLFEALIEIFCHIVEFDREKANLDFNYQVINEICGRETDIAWNSVRCLNSSSRNARLLKPGQDTNRGKEEPSNMARLKEDDDHTIINACQRKRNSGRIFSGACPSFDRRDFREALVNALVHRDYSRLGAVHVRLDDDGLSISNPGGFVEGVTL